MSRDVHRATAHDPSPSPSSCNGRTRDTVLEGGDGGGRRSTINILRLPEDGDGEGVEEEFTGPVRSREVDGAAGDSPLSYSFHSMQALMAEEEPLQRGQRERRS